MKTQPIGPSPAALPKQLHAIFNLAATAWAAGDRIDPFFLPSVRNGAYAYHCNRPHRLFGIPSQVYFYFNFKSQGQTTDSRRRARTLASFRYRNP
jgi:hypothetical protein